MRLFAVVGANAAENVTLLGEIGALEAERTMQTLRRELEDEVALHRSLLEIQNRLGLASAAASVEIFPLIVERLAEVVPIQSATISRVDHNAQSIRPIYHSEPGAVADAMLLFEIPFGIGATGVAVMERKSKIANAGDPEGAIAVDVPGTHADDEHVLAVPVLVDERVRAALTLHRPATMPAFTAADARRAELFGQHIISVLLLLELAETGKELSESRRALSEQVEQLESLNRMKDEFVANVSHELRTPLTAVIGNVATVARSGDTLEPEERRELLNAAERQAKRLAELLENLLATSRLAGETPTLAPLRIELASFAEEVAAALRSRAPHRTIEVLAPPHLDIVTDPTLLYRILYNLGDNALKYSDDEVRLHGAVRRGRGVDRRHRPRDGRRPSRTSPASSNVSSSSTRRIPGASAASAWASTCPTAPRRRSAGASRSTARSARARRSRSAFPGSSRFPPRSGARRARHTAKRTCSTSPSRTMYSLPSTRSRPFAFARVPAAALDQIVVAHDLGADEPALQVGMDDSGRLGREAPRGGPPRPGSRPRRW